MRLALLSQAHLQPLCGCYRFTRRRQFKDPQALGSGYKLRWHVKLNWVTPSQLMSAEEPQDPPKDLTWDS